MDLRSALLLVGAIVVILVAVSAFGRGWLRRRWEQWRAEPVSAADPSAPPARGSAPADRAGDGAAPVIERNAEHYARIFGAGPSAGRPDEHLDFIVHLPLEEPAGRTEVLRVYRQREYDLDRPHAVYGRAQGGEWSDIERDSDATRYDELALAIQLADVRGAANDTELNTLASIALDLADGCSGRTLFLEDFDRALERGTELEHFSRAHDLIASIHILANSAEGFTGRAIDQAAHRVGMQYGARNLYHFGDAGSGARVLFSLADLCQPGEFDLGRINELRTPGVTLFMLVPCVSDPGDAFARMAGAATTLSRVLDGRMLDSDRRGLSPEGLARIRGQIDRIADGMHAAGIPPGSHTARRLFGDAMGG